MKLLNKVRNTVATNVMNFLREEDGVGVVEMILILVVLIGLVLIFKEQLTSIVNKIFKTISDKASSV
ncbi:Putative Flagellin, Flp1-like, domain [Lachnobacterium bovis DSM 14045]|uniref:Putative Flagellin, Flp1-like, domain n=2 Tax=Lachnobacterium bovis TaxID=140626 RepID=A0A1H3K4G9_9FIRM|nr:Flp1 family type IVb pilin [Lachnobacterium bovis]SDY46498.1 Putative Flagellin, Flp1-like, domain [Lachnobacterium bovis DSM 14045]